MDQAKVLQEHVRGQRAPETYLEKYFSQLEDISQWRQCYVQGKIGGPWGKYAPQFPLKSFLSKI